MVITIFWKHYFHHPSISSSTKKILGQILKNCGFPIICNSLYKAKFVVCAFDMKGKHHSYSCYRRGSECIQRFKSFQQICHHPWQLKNARHEVRLHKFIPLAQLSLPQGRYQWKHPTPSPSKTSIKWLSTRPRCSFNVIYQKRFQSEEALVLPWCCKNSQRELSWVLCNNEWTWWS